MQIKAVLFDIDGTLVDSNELHVAAWEQAFGEAGHAIDAAAIRGQIGQGADHLVPALLPGVDQAAVEALGDRHGAIFKDRYLDRVQPFAGARDLVACVHGDGRQVVLASSASQAELDHYVTLLGIGALVTANTSIDDVERSKPAADIFAAALGKLKHVASDEAIAIGDTPYDVAAAGAAGVATIGLRSGGFSDAALAGATAIYDDVAALLAGIDGSPLR